MKTISIEPETILIKGQDLTDTQKAMLRFKGMKDEQWVKNHSFYFTDGRPSNIEGFEYPISHSFSHLPY